MGRWRIALVVVAMLPLAAGCAGAVQQQTALGQLAAQADAAATPRLDWTDCAEQQLAGYECAAARVPLDYARPDGETIELALVRQRAGDPQRRLGTLFAAAGGPGNSGLDWARGGPMFPGEISRRFDVVTFDQRGVGASAPVRCFADAAEQERFWSTMVLPPADAEQQLAAERAARAYAAGCARHSGALLPHLTTVDAARDLDLLRRAVGEDHLTFTGGSYATYLGQVYGALFGERVRALHLTSVIDPAVYGGDTRAEIAGTAAGTAEVFEEFLRLCAQAGRPECAFAEGGERSELVGESGPGAAEKAGSSGTERPSVTLTTAAGPAEADVERLRARDAALLERLRTGPITVGTGEQAVRVGYAEVVQAHALLLYDPRQGWPALAGLLAELDRGPHGDPAPVRQALAGGATPLDFLDSFTAITCADATLPRDPARWPALAQETPAATPDFDDFWLYMRQPCAAWPTPEQDARHVAGPWTLISDKPALLVNNRYDPATPLEFARRAQQELVNARLVVVEGGYGHEPGGECVRSLRERYLIDLQLPAPGATCTADRAPFAS
ncbi:alpha/beta hydrolase [Nocardia farcinica]|uniref:alpha/beta hydrolase n=1 Tax=Nocardia farcinica TaxID=37329 RepID=UPI00245463CB|nr:alpha/beta hydrolase [Nocardia farcinica]